MKDKIKKILRENNKNYHRIFDLIAKKYSLYKDKNFFIADVIMYKDDIVLLVVNLTNDSIFDQASKVIRDIKTYFNVNVKMYHYKKKDKYIPKGKK